MLRWMNSIILYRHPHAGREPRGFLSILMAILCLAGFSCTPREGLLIKPEKFGREIHSVTVLPVYLDRELIPALPSSWQRFDLPPEYRKKFRERIEGSAGDCDRAVSEALRSSRFTLTVKIYKGGIRLNEKTVARTAPCPEFPIQPRLSSSEKKKVSNKDRDRMYWWAYNYRYRPDRALIRRIAREEKTDGVWFHSLQVTIPGSMHAFRYQLTYEAVLYDRDGSPVYKKVYYDGNGYRPASLLDLTQRYEEKSVYKGGGVTGFVLMGITEGAVEAAMKKDLPEHTTWDEWSKSRTGVLYYTLPLSLEKLKFQDLEYESLLKTMKQRLKLEYTPVSEKMRKDMKKNLKEMGK